MDEASKMARSAASRGKPSSIIYLDWDNLRIGLLNDGFVLDPVAFLKIILQSIGQRSPKDVRHPEEVRLYFASGLETRVDRRRLRAPAFGANVELRPVWDDKDMADIELTIDAVTATVEDPSVHVLIVSFDNDLARVAQELSRRLGKANKGGRALLVSPRGRPQILKEEESNERTRYVSLSGLLEQNVKKRALKPSRRPRRRWDDAAWALRTTFSDRMGAKAGTALLTGTDLQWWNNTVLGRDSLSTSEVEVVDSVLAYFGARALDTQVRADAGGLPIAGLVEEIAARCPLVPSGESVHILAALRDSGFLRYRDHRHLDFAMCSFEGVLFPVRRGLLLTPLPAHPSRLREDIGARVRAGVPSRQGLDREELRRFHDVADEEWKMVERVLERRLKVIRVDGEKPARRADPRRWWLHSTKQARFAIETFATATQLLAHFDRPQTKSELLERFTACGVPREAMWLRTLAETGLIKKERGDLGLWVSGDIELGQGAGTAR